MLDDMYPPDDPNGPTIPQDELEGWQRHGVTARLAQAEVEAFQVALQTLVALGHKTADGAVARAATLLWTSIEKCRLFGLSKVEVRL